MNALESLRYFSCEFWILGGAFTVLILDLFFKQKKMLGWIALVFLAIATYYAKAPSAEMPLFFGFFELSRFTAFFRFLAIGITAATILLSMTYKPLKHYVGEYYSLFLFMTFGLILMASSANLLMIFLAIEFVSILSYLLTGYLKHNAASKEASVKYLLFGSAASGMMLYGMSLLFGASGSLELAVIQQNLSSPSFYAVGFAGALLFLVGVGFKVSMAPFHLWAPDVYEGAPTPVTAFLTVGPKALGFAVLMRLLMMIYPWLGERWTILISALAAVTMTLGNVTAVSQGNIKRLLAYSSIAQAGYILMGIAAVNQTGMTAVLIYLLAYAFTNLGAFCVVIMVSNHLDSDSLDAYRGLSKRSPLYAAALTAFLLSLAGLPPLAGFIGKFFVFSAAIEAGLYTLAVIAALNSAVAGYYYFRIVRMMYLAPVLDSEATPIPQTAPLSFTLCLLLAGVFLLGVMPAPFIAWAKWALFL